MTKIQIAGWVLDQDLAAQRYLDDLDVPAHDVERFLGIGQRQQIVEISPVNYAPRQMLGHRHWIDPVDECCQLPEMASIDALGTAQRQADAVETDRIVATDLLERVAQRSAVHVVLGVDLEPSEGGTRR